MRAIIVLCVLMGVATLLAPAALAGPAHDAGMIQADIETARSKLKVEPETALAEAQQAAALARRNLNGKARDVALAQSDVVIGRALIGLDRTADAERVLRTALARSRSVSIDAKITGDLILSIGRLDERRSNVQGALSNFQRAYALFRSAGDKRSQALALQSIAKLYADGGDGQTALRYYKQSDEDYGGDTLMSISSRNNRGMALLFLSKPKEAEAEFRAALIAATKLARPQYTTRVLSNIAQAQVSQGQYDAAAETLDRAFVSARAGDSDDRIWALWELRAQIALKRRQHRVATAAIERALRGVDPVTSDSIYRQAHDHAYQIYRATGRQAEALVQLEAVARLDEATAKLTATNSAALMAARFDFARQNTRIAELKASELELQRNFLIAVIAGGTLALVLLSVSLILITRSRNRERAARLLLAQTNRDLEKAIAAKMEFLATTSHEIRTPLNGILGMTQVMLADRKIDALMRDRISVVHGAGETMRALVDDILDVAKMETGKLAVGIGMVELKTTLRHVAQVWRLQAEAAGIAITLNLDDCPERIEGDAGRIRQIIFNLLSNAMKFTEKGKVELAVRTDQPGEARRIRISVRDSGIGIAREWHESIFELFQQVDGGTTRKYGGTGLGLAICRNLARAMGGDITVESEPGFGSTFTLDLPLIDAPEAVACPQSGERPTTVLVIEHNPLARGMLRAILSERFEQVALVDTVAEAAGFLALNEADWIIADSASVDDFSALIGATEVPMVLIGDEDIPGAARQRAHAILPKPFTKSALLRVVATPASPVAVAA